MIALLFSDDITAISCGGLDNGEVANKCIVDCLLHYMRQTMDRKYEPSERPHKCDGNWTLSCSFQSIEIERMHEMDRPFYPHAFSSWLRALLLLLRKYRCTKLYNPWIHHPPRVDGDDSQTRKHHGVRNACSMRNAPTRSLGNFAFDEWLPQRSQGDCPIIHFKFINVVLEAHLSLFFQQWHRHNYNLIHWWWSQLVPFFEFLNWRYQRNPLKIVKNGTILLNMAQN